MSNHLTVIAQAFGQHNLEPVPVHVAIGTAAAALPQLEMPTPAPTDPEAAAQGKALAELEVIAAGALDQGIANAIGFIRAAAKPAEAMRALAAAFAEELKAKGHKAHAQRACDLRAVLKAALANQEFAPVGGLQVAARQARQIVKARSRAAGAGRKAKSKSGVIKLVSGSDRRFYMVGYCDMSDGTRKNVTLEAYAQDAEQARAAWVRFHGNKPVIRRMFVQIEV